VRSFERRFLPIGLLALVMITSGLRLARAQQWTADPPPPRRTPIIVGLPVAQPAESGEIALQPNVVVNGTPPPFSSPYSELHGLNGVQPIAFAEPPVAPPDSSNRVVPAGATMPPLHGRLVDQATVAPPPANMPLPDPFGQGAEQLPPGANSTAPRAEPLFTQPMGGDCGCGPGGGGHHASHGGTFYGLGGVEEGTGDPGIGQERVMFALFEIDSSQPSSNMRFRFNAAYDEHNPDRAEYFWAQIGGRGPKLPEKLVDYQDVIASWEVATGKAFSITTDIPIRLVAPEVNPATSGLGDLSLTTKTVLLNGADWQITQIFRTDLPTGDPGHGTGTGHVSLEPGFLFQLKWSPQTYFHGELTYWFPLGGNPVFDGQVLKYGFGVSHLLYENDTFAAIPTLEFVGWTVFNGAQTTFPTGLPQPVDTMGIFNVRPGIRFVRDTGGDLGLFEWGLSTAFGITNNKWYNASVLVEARFVF
jgi:hypothetical protein